MITQEEAQEKYDEDMWDFYEKWWKIIDKIIANNLRDIFAGKKVTIILNKWDLNEYEQNKLVKTYQEKGWRIEFEEPELRIKVSRI